MLQVTSGLDSPSLDDLESKKRLLLDALKDENKSGAIVESEEEVNDDNNAMENIDNNKNSDIIKEKVKERERDKSLEQDELDEQNEKDATNDDIKMEDVEQPDSVLETSITMENKTPGQVKGTEYGTPVMNVASPYMKLPTDVKFSKDISDIINFENLPNSIGTFKRMKTLLKKVKSEVDRIQES